MQALATSSSRLTAPIFRRHTAFRKSTCYQSRPFSICHSNLKRRSHVNVTCTASRNHETNSSKVDVDSPFSFLATAAGLGLGSLLLLTVADSALASELGTAAQQSHGYHPIADIASQEEFWSNMARYGRFFVSVMVGTGYVMLKPFAEALKRPVTAVFVLVGLVALYFFVSFTVRGAEPLSLFSIYTQDVNNAAMLTRPTRIVVSAIIVGLLQVNAMLGLNSEVVFAT